MTQRVPLAANPPEQASQPHGAAAFIAAVDCARLRPHRGQSRALDPARKKPAQGEARGVASSPLHRAGPDHLCKAVDLAPFGWAWRFGSSWCRAVLLQPGKRHERSRDTVAAKGARCPSADLISAPSACSRTNAAAAGVGQFMPSTPRLRGPKILFDPTEAIAKSAALFA
jgi:hypothetical protein